MDHNKSYNFFCTVMLIGMGTAGLLFQWLGMGLLKMDQTGAAVVAILPLMVYVMIVFVLVGVYLGRIK